MKQITPINSTHKNPNFQEADQLAVCTRTAEKLKQGLSQTNPATVVRAGLQLGNTRYFKSWAQLFES